MPTRESLWLLLAMIGIAVASVGIAEGLISPDIFAAIVGVVIVTTRLTPAMLRGLLRPKKHSNRLNCKL